MTGKFLVSNGSEGERSMVGWGVEDMENLPRDGKSLTSLAIH